MSHGPTLTRRNFARSACALGAAALLPGAAQAMAGRYRLTTLSDGALSLPRGMVYGDMPQAELDTLLSTRGMTQETIARPCNLTLLEGEGRLILIDAGAGPDFLETTGHLPDTLDAAGIDPQDITHVLFTHAHPDHLWGVLDDFDDPMFPEAEHMIGRAEFDYWTNPNTVATIGAARQSFAAGAARRLDLLADQMTFFEDGQELLPGLAALATPGHTPGHMSFVAGDMVIGGDAIGDGFIALARPDWPSGMDQDMAQAAQTRVRLLDWMVANQLGLSGFHLPGDGIGQIERAKDGYVFVAGA